MSRNYSAAYVSSVTTRREAIAAVRAEANAIIEQGERRARGLDRGAWRDDMRIVDRNSRNTIARTIRDSVAVAFALSRKFAAEPQQSAPGHAVTDELQAAGIVEAVTLDGLPEGIAAFRFI